MPSPSSQCINFRLQSRQIRHDIPFRLLRSRLIVSCLINLP